MNFEEMLDKIDSAVKEWENVKKEHDLDDELIERGKQIVQLERFRKQNQE